MFFLFVIGLLGHWSLSHWVIGSLGHWVIGSLGHWVIGSLGHWAIGSLGHWVIGSLGHWVIGSLGHWVIGSLGHWVIGENDLECPNGQMAQCPMAQCLNRWYRQGSYAPGADDRGHGARRRLGRQRGHVTSL